MITRTVPLVLLLLCFLVSCAAYSETKDTSASRERDYVNTEITYSESVAQYAFRLNMESIETEFAKFFFEPDIDVKEREACIETTDKVLSNQTLENAYPEIYIFSQNRYNYKYIVDHRLYLSLQDWNSVEYITDVLLAAYGESAHYGTAFGYANYLAKSNHWNSFDGKFSNPSVSDIRDLDYLCFNENFASVDDIACAKELACDFADFFISKHGEKVFQQLLISCSKATDALTAYYKAYGVSYAPSAVQYGYGGKKCDYLVYSDYGTFYISKDWIDINADYNPLITDGFLHSDYAVTKAFFETNLKQMKQYQELFNLDSYNNDLDIVFSNPLSISKSSFYQNPIHRIYLCNVDSLMHEYIHSLTMPSSASTSLASWQVEGFARYFSYYFDFYGTALLNQDYNNTPDTPELKYIHEFSAVINRPIDITIDYQELENIAVYSRSWTNPNENYLTGSSFVQYLVKQYGEEAVINSIYGNGTPLPKKNIELIKDWNKYIESEYAEYSKYE